MYFERLYRKICTVCRIIRHNDGNDDEVLVVRRRQQRFEKIVKATALRGLVTILVVMFFNMWIVNSIGSTAESKTKRQEAIFLCASCYNSLHNMQKRKSWRALLRLKQRLKQRPNSAFTEVRHSINLKHLAFLNSFYLFLAVIFCTMCSSEKVEGPFFRWNKS